MGDKDKREEKRGEEECEGVTNLLSEYYIQLIIRVMRESMWIGGMDVMIYE